ncbi:MAG: ABC transporter permease [Fibrobacterota bacterium]|nr:MAG: ABC transporter permease [Fibrobacterota bacterium]
MNLAAIQQRRLALAARHGWFEGALSATTAAALFLLASSVFFAVLGKSPFVLLGQILTGAFGSRYGFTETLVKTTPILLCALATALPARLGLLTVGASGQFYLGAWCGTAIVLSAPAGWSVFLFLPVFALACAGGAFWALIPGFLKARLEVNETLSTLLLNYIASLLVDWVVYGSWRDPANLGWPATAPFPDAIKLPLLVDGTRLHAGLLLAVAIAVALHVVLSKSRWGLSLRILKSNRVLGEGTGLPWAANVALVMAIGGAIAGLAGILETTMIHGRLQSGIALNFGLTGFLVAWMAGQHMLRIIPLALAMGALMSASDALQLFAQLPEATATVLQAILFCSVLVSGGLLSKGRN